MGETVALRDCFLFVDLRYIFIYYFEERTGISMKKLLALLCSAALAMVLLTGCGNTATEPETATEETGEETAETVDDTAILVVSFGTSYLDSQKATIGAIEEAIRAAYPQYEVRRAFTSQIIIDKLAERDGIEIDNVTQALDRAVADGIKTLIVQPTHLMNGFEYTDLKNALETYADSFDQIVLGEPLLTSDQDFAAVIDAVTADTASYDDGETAIVFMGHGTEADSNGVYAAMQEKITAGGFVNYYIGTVEATPSLDDVITAIDGKGYTKVVLEPLMVVAGDHANNDMAGDEDDSWKSILTAKGYDVTCILEGLGQKPAIQAIYVDHVKAAIDQLG